MTKQLPVTQSTAAPKKQKKRKKRFRWLWWLVPILAILGAGAVATVTLYNQAMDVKDDLTAMKDELKVVVEQVKSGDTDGIAVTAEKIKTLSASANKTVDTPLWDVAAKVPFVGANIQAVAETTKATDIIVSESLPTVLDLLKTLDISTMKVEGGGVDLQPFRDALPMMPELSATFAKAQTHLDKIDREAILPFVEENIGQVLDMVGQATPLIAIGEKYLPTILPMLGDGSTRTYAVVFQNNAEIRATGGNPGNAAIMTISDGKVEMREDWAVVAFAALGYGGSGLDNIAPEEKAALFEWDTTKYMQNYSRFPDFADTSSLMQQQWTKATGETLDGVISLDPVMLSYMLTVAGDVDVPGYDQKITGENAVQVLLSDAYEKYPESYASQAFFDAASGEIFSKIMGGDWDPMTMIDAFKRGLDEQRIYMSFVQPAEQAMIAEGGMDGRLNTDIAEPAQVGIYLNDASYSKLEYYLTSSMAVSCDVGARTVTTAITLTNDVPGNHLGGYTLGARNGSLGFSNTTMLLDVMSFAQPGGALVTTSPESGAIQSMDRYGNYNGLEGKSIFTAVGMGETETVSFTSTVAAGANGPLEVRYSPTTKQTAVTIAPSCAELFPGTEISQ